MSEKKIVVVGSSNTDMVVKYSSAHAWRNRPRRTIYDDSGW